ncbi:MAG: ribosome biogenesis GTPase Der [Leptospiraceae bacterium]|nr:ribosome biogenesis GTPase Der [Leptospiraceae bacterium]
MNDLPVVSIVGRQNVGKSTLFNLILKKNRSITYDFPGVTRDIIKEVIQREDLEKEFLLCDTPGLDIININDMSSNIIQLSFEQLVSSDVIIFLMAKGEILDYDYKLIDLFQRDKRFQNKNILYCVNKSDNPEEEFELEFFYRLGLEEVIPISAKGRRNLKLLLDKIQYFLKDTKTKLSGKIDAKICIVGKPNSGKSSLLNSLTNTNRAVVSEKAGTTRDSVNEILKLDSKLFEIIDTAGIRKESRSTDDSIEYYSYTRAISSIEESEVVVHLIDAKKGMGDFDKKIFTLIREKGKPIILVISKWDLIEDKDSNTFKEYKEKLFSRFPPSKDVPILAISSTEGQRVHKLLRECLILKEKSIRKIPTHELNKTLGTWMKESKMASLLKNRPKLLYVTQVSTCPFKLILFVNHKEHFKENVIAYLRNQVTKEYDLAGIPVQFEVRSDREKEKEFKKKVRS